MKTDPLKWCSLALLLLGPATLVQADETKHELPIRIEQAIEKAKQHVTLKKMDVSDMHISSAKLELNTNGKHGPYWLVTWVPSSNYHSQVVVEGEPMQAMVLGGQLFVSVFFDQKIEISYGE